MSQMMVKKNPPAPSDGNHHIPDDSIRRISRVGVLILLGFFGGIGTWSMVAPLNGAVVANGFVKVEGNRKSVQHLDGGIVKELRIKEGSKVNSGDVIIVLDDTQARAEFEVLSQQYVVLRASEERLRAQLDHQTQMAMPGDLKALTDDPYVDSIWKGQIRQLSSRLEALEGQRNVIKEKIAQLEYQIVGAQAQVKAFEAQIKSVKGEAESIQPLVAQGLVSRPRILQLERQGDALQGQIGDTNATIAKYRQAIAEQVQQTAQLDYDNMSDATKELRDIQAKLLEVIPRLSNAKAVLGRMEIRSPYSGQVVGLSVFSVGGVIIRGEKVLDIVPEQELLGVEAQVAVEDISEVQPGMRAEVNLTAYKQRLTPKIHGDVIQVSADRLTDPKTNNPYFNVLVRLDEEDLKDVPNIRLYPGMPAVVLIPTIQRTAMDYMIGPLLASFHQAFRQR